jgi:glycosyltransferase involved in cell wall biosynthesis
MRVTFVIASADLTGGCRVISIHAENLRKRGHEVHVVIRPPRRVDFLDQVRALLRREPVPRTPKHWLTHYDPLIGRPGVTIRAVDRHRPITAADLPDADVVVATWWESAEWIWRLPPRKGVKVHFMQDYETWGGHVERVDATCRLPMPKITPARWVKRMLGERFGQTDVTCVPNAVDCDVFCAPPRGKQPSPTVGFTYTSFEAKGCDVIISAIELGRKQRADLKVVCFGSSRPTPRIPLPMPAEFHFCAPDHQLKELYGRCDAWLFGTRKEGFGLPLLEAMACRTPVIATPAGAAPELIAPGGGVLVPIDDAEAMAREIERVVSLPPDAWRKMSDIAHATANGYSWAQATDLFEAALQAAVDARR